MKPFLNIDEIENFEESDNGPFKEKYAVIAPKIGAKKLGYSLSVVPPGKKACPFHNHQINEEMFLILEGTGLLRFGDKEYPLKKHDIISCPPGGQEVAHQIINTGEAELKYLSLSTMEPYEICEYPDSKKMLALVADGDQNRFKHIGKLEQAVNYFEGEV